MKIELNNNNKDKEVGAFFDECLDLLKRENFEVFKFTNFGFQIFLHNIGFINIDKIKLIQFKYDEVLKMYELSIAGDGFHLIKYFKKLDGEN